VADIFSLRVELNVQLKNIARLAPHLVREVVRQVLSNAIPAEGNGQNVCWQNVEAAVSALYTLGEGADDPAVKPMSSAERVEATNGTGEVSDTPLGALAVSLIRQWGPNLGRAAYHRIVAPIFLETCVRYHAVLERDDTALVMAMTAFLDDRGIQHFDQAVRSRACYLFSRLCRPLRCKLSDRVEDIMRVLPARLAEAAQAMPEADRTSTSVSAVGVQNKAMAESGNDDRLYLFEASGTLLGADEVPESQQRDFLTQLAMALVQQIEDAIEGEGVQDVNVRVALATRAVQAIGNVSKGFSQRTCLITRPRTGDVFRSCLEVTLKCLDAWPRDASVRNRVTGFVHRMIEILGPTITQHLASTMDKLRRDAGAVELRETLVLFNQLLMTYKDVLAPFVVDILPSLTSQVFSVVAQAHEHMTMQPQTFNTETVREAGELDRTWLATAAGLGKERLINLVFTGANIERTAELREQTLIRLMESATSHPMVSARKTAIQALKYFVDAWMVDASPLDEATAATMTSAAVILAAPPRGEIVPGFTQFAVTRICTECCILPSLRGDLNLGDAISVTVLNESNAILSLAFSRQRDALERVLLTGLFPAILPGMDYNRVARIVAEYQRLLGPAVVKSTINSKPTRDLVEAIRAELERAHDASTRPLELRPRPARRGT
jgi:exportin-T